MEKSQLFFINLILLVVATKCFAGEPIDLQRNRKVTHAGTFAAGSSLSGTTVAGGHGGGSALNQLNQPQNVFLDASGNIYVADQTNNRVVKWAPGASSGVIVAGGNGAGSAANQLTSPTDVFVDAAGNIYVADSRNYRIQKWAPGASAGVTVAGGHDYGNALNQVNSGTVFVDAAGNIYVADPTNDRILKWAPGATEGVIVCGGNGRGSAANQLFYPTGVFVDPNGNIYIADELNQRIQKWAFGATAGITVAGGNGSGSNANQVSYPHGLYVDGAGNLYIADVGNERVQKWAPGAIEGVTVAGGNGEGSAANQLFEPSDVFVDPSGSIYVADLGNSRIQKFEVPMAAGSPAKGVTVAGGNGNGPDANQVRYPVHSFVDAGGNIYIADQLNNRIQKWAPGAITGITVAGGNGLGDAANQLNYPTGVFVDASANVYVADRHNNRIQKWSPGAVSGVTVAGGNGEGSAASQLFSPTNIFVDAGGNIFIADANNYRIQKWAPGSASGVTVAGGNGMGTSANQFAYPYDIVVNLTGDIFVADQANERIQKWTAGASSGVTIAGGNGQGGAANQLHAPYGIALDESGNLYIADTWNQRIQKWAPSSIAGSTVAGGNLQAGGPSDFNYPFGVALDTKGNIYVADEFNARIQKFEATGLSYKFYQGNWSTLPDFNALVPLKTGTSPNTNITLRTPGINDNFGFLWEGRIKLPVAGTYIFETISDDGSRLYFNSKYSAQAIPTVDNDGIHPPQSVKTSINITEAGSYPIAITFFDNNLGETLQVYWTGPNISRQLIPDSVFNSGTGGDSIAPGSPGNLHVVSKVASSINLAWDNASDNVGVTAYDIFAGDIYKATTSNLQITLDGLTADSSYSFKVRARDVAGNISGFSNTTSVSTGNSTNGLTYRYYEGTWDMLPDFSTLTPVKTGNSSNVDISVRPAGRNDNFAFVWEGYINIPTAGTYTFETISDDGSKLYFNSLYIPSAIPTVSNDGVHAPVSVSATVNVAAPGVYPISVTFFEKDGGESMQVFWSGPGFGRQAIPDAAFIQSTKPLSLTYKYYEGDFSALPDFTAILPIKTGTSNNVDINVRPSYRNDNFAFMWEGKINIPAPGSYTFETYSDDGSNIYFNIPYGPTVTPTVINNGVHAPRSVSKTVNVPAAGSYPIIITYFEKDQGEVMQMYWSGPGFTRQLVPDVAFATPSGETVPPSAPSNLQALYSGVGFIHLDWDNSTDNVGVTGYDIYVNGVKKYTCTESAFTADKLDPNTTYAFYIVARDLAGNSSQPSNTSYLSTTATTSAGLKYRYYEGTWTTLPDFNLLTPVRSGESPLPDISYTNNGVTDHFGFVWEGYINIPTPGAYTFETISDDGSRLYFNSFYVPGASPLVNNDGLHAASSATGTVNITTAGRYPIAITFFENDGGQQMQVYWSGPGFSRQLLSPASFSGIASLPVIESNRNISAEVAKDNITITRIYPDPFIDKFKIDFYNDAASNDVMVKIRDLKGSLLFTYRAGKLTAGNNSITVPVNGLKLINGVYLVTLDVNGKPFKTVSLIKAGR